MCVQQQILNTDQINHSDNKLLNTERNCKICLEQYDFKSFCDVELLFYERVKIQIHVGHIFLSVNLSVMGRMKQC